MSTGLAAVFTGAPGRLKFRDLPVSAPNPGEILTRVLGCTLCGSDIHTFLGRRTVPTPTILGHEVVAEVVSWGGPTVPRDFAGTQLKPGDRVTWAIVAHCGTCRYCLRGLPQKCLHGVKYGHEPLSPGKEWLGGLAEYCMLVPGTTVFRLPESLPLPVACPAGCAAATIFASLEGCELAQRSICILGAGMLGLTLCALAATRGAGPVVCVDRLADRRALALEFGASLACDNHQLADVAQQLVGNSVFDYVVELSGDPAAFSLVWPLVGIGGTLLLVGGVYPAAPVGFPMQEFVRRMLTLRGIHNYAPRHLSQALAFLEAQQAHFPFAKLVSQWFPLRRALEAFDLAASGKAVRVGVSPGLE